MRIPASFTRIPCSILQMLRLKKTSPERIRRESAGNPQGIRKGSAENLNRDQRHLEEMNRRDLINEPGTGKIIT